KHALALDECLQDASGANGLRRSLEGVAVQHGQVGELADLDGSGDVVEVVHVGRTRCVGGHGAGQVDALLGEEDLVVALLLAGGGEPVDGHVNGGERIWSAHRPVTAGGKDGAVPQQI